MTNVFEGFFSKHQTVLDLLWWLFACWHACVKMFCGLFLNGKLRTMYVLRKVVLSLIDINIIFVRWLTFSVFTTAFKVRTWSRLQFFLFSGTNQQVLTNMLKSHSNIIANTKKHSATGVLHVVFKLCVCYIYTSVCYNI